MRRRVFFFVISLLLILLIVPVYNLITTSNIRSIKWMNQSFLYNMDFASRWASRLLYPLGISTDPKQVIIGHDGWLFLGDQHDQTLSTDRRPQEERDRILGKDIGAATVAWQIYLANKGVKVFRIMIGPNKSTIYSEHMPVWSRPFFSNATDALLAGTGTGNYIDLRSPLLAAKVRQSEPLYYKTDTHWNALGAGLAFQAFEQQVSIVAPEIKWPTRQTYVVQRADFRPGGDLANFLRLKAYLPDSEPVIHLGNSSVDILRYEFDTKIITYQGKNSVFEPPTKPIMVQSKQALNNKKVLWLRDSFGDAMAPLMSATFSEVLQLHWNEAIKPGGRFVQLVDAWQPDYVFITVVERAARNPWFSAYPPVVVLSGKKDFEPVRATNVVKSNHLSIGALRNDFQVIGGDPFVEYGLSVPIKPGEVTHLAIDLTCVDGSTSIPMQLFWLMDGHPDFDEEHSKSFSFPSGKHVIDLRTLPKWSTTAAVSRIRVDVDPKNSCIHFKLDNPIFGSHNAVP